MNDKVKEALRKNPHYQSALNLLGEFSGDSPCKINRPGYLNALIRRRSKPDFEKAEDAIKGLKRLGLIDEENDKIIVKKEAFNYMRR